jgi:predicted dehydrogenase
MVDLSSVARYADFHEMFADPNVDLVDLCLPPAMHAEAAVAAAKAGKHVFCEKPMALTTADCRRMVAATQQANKLLFIGHVLPFVPEYAHALKIVRDGKYGRLLGGSFKRVISDPLWLKDFYDPQRVGGPMLDLHIHDAHFIRLLFGQPTAVTTRGRMRGEVVEYFNTFFEFADPSVAVSATSGVINQQGRPFTHGFEIQLEKATLIYDLAVYADGVEAMPLRVLPANGKVVRPKLSGADMPDAFVDEIKEVVKCVAAGQPSSTLDGGLAQDAVVICHKQTESVKKGKTAKV